MAKFYDITEWNEKPFFNTAEFNLQMQQNSD